MSAQIEIPPYYKDLVNQKSLAELKNNVMNIAKSYSAFASSEAINNRENDSFDVYTDQYNKDMIYLKNMIMSAQKIVNTCNESLYLISGYAMQNHIFFNSNNDEEE